MQMPPTPPVKNILDACGRDSELVCYGEYGHASAFMHGADSQNIGFTEPGRSDFTASWPGVVTKFIIFILKLCGPAKIVRAVITCISVPMRHLVVFRRTRAVEYFTNYTVRGYGMPSVERDVLVSGVRFGLQNATMKKSRSAETINFPPIQRSHAAQTGNLIGRPPWHWTPFFEFGYRTISHVRSSVALWSGREGAFPVPLAPVQYAMKGVALS
jgi:hypothetical protein